MGGCNNGEVVRAQVQVPIVPDQLGNVGGYRANRVTQIRLPRCRRCNARSIIRRNGISSQLFLGCETYPACHFTNNIEFVYEVPEDVVGLMNNLAI